MKRKICYEITQRECKPIIDAFEEFGNYSVPYKSLDELSSTGPIPFIRNADGDIVLKAFNVGYMIAIPSISESGSKNDENHAISLVLDHSLEGYVEGILEKFESEELSRARLLKR
jgi:hypothetical protein|tara:strand:- start:64 stop:408 length:345 start_codon:yes stop_codon:yes gene_type:complete